MHELTPRLEALFEICSASVFAVLAISINYLTPEFKMFTLIAFAIWTLIALYIAAIVLVEPTPSKNRERPRRSEIGFWVMFAGFPVSDVFDNSILGVLVILAGLLLTLNSIQLRERQSHAMETSEEEKAPD